MECPKCGHKIYIKLTPEEIIMEELVIPVKPKAKAKVKPKTKNKPKAKPKTKPKPPTKGS